MRRGLELFVHVQEDDETVMKISRTRAEREGGAIVDAD